MEWSITPDWQQSSEWQRTREIRIESLTPELQREKCTYKTLQRLEGSYRRYSSSDFDVVSGVEGHFNFPSVKGFKPLGRLPWLGNRTSSLLKCMSKDASWKDFHNAKQKWNRQMDIQYDKHVYCRNGKWLITITLYDTLKKVPWPRPRKKKNDSGRSDKANNSKIDSAVQQMKTTSLDGNVGAAGRGREESWFACKKGISKHTVSTGRAL